MSATPRQRLARLVRVPDVDLAELALLCCTEVDPDLHVEAELLRLDALADGLRSRGFTSTEPSSDAAALAGYLAGDLGFGGDRTDYHDPRNGLLSEVLERKQGLPITLSIVYVAIARRLGVPAFGIGLPGHFVTGVGADARPVVLDPFHGGIVLGERELAERVDTATAGRVAFTRSMLRPQGPADVVRRLLNNLTRDFADRARLRDALWTVELKHLLPNTVPDDHRVRGQLLLNLGRYGEAADAFEAYVEVAPEDEPDVHEVARMAVRARARLN